MLGTSDFAIGGAIRKWQSLTHGPEDRVTMEFMVEIHASERSPEIRAHPHGTLSPPALAAIAIDGDDDHMGIVRARISLSNPKDNALAPLDVQAVVDTGATHLCIPEHVAVQLGLQEMYKREVTVVDGRRTLCAYVGPVHVTFANRGCFTGALVLGDEVLLGAVPMEDMDLVISPARLSIEVNPQSPNVPMAMVK